MSFPERGLSSHRFLRVAPKILKFAAGRLRRLYPGALENFLNFPPGKTFSVKLSVATNDGRDESHARIFIGVDGADANFLVTTQKINGEKDRVEGMTRHLRVERNFRDKTGEIEPFAERQRIYLDALKDVMTLWNQRFTEVDQTLLCGACSSKIHRLPGPVVG